MYEALLPDTLHVLLLIFTTTILQVINLSTIEYSNLAKTHSSMILSLAKVPHQSSGEILGVFFVCFGLGFLATPQGVRDLSFPIRDRSPVSCSGSKES